LNEPGDSFLQCSRIDESEKPLRIAFFTETFLPSVDGTVTRLCHTIRHLRRRGHSVLVIAPQGGPSEFEGASIHGVPSFPFPLYPELKLAVPRPSVGRALAAFRPDLIHAAHPAFLGAAAFYYSVGRGIPLVVSYHCQLPKWLHYYRLGRLEPLAWWALKLAYNGADITLATSQWMQAELREHGFKRVELWQRGVDTRLFHPGRATAEMRARLTQGHPDDPLLLYVGRLSAEKDIEQCRPVLASSARLRLALVGDGPHRRKLEEHYSGTPTYFAGFLKGAELAAAFACADVLFMPSQTETLGLVVLEAMAAGCPVVAVRAGGIVDLVQDGVTGHLYNPGDLAGAVGAVQLLLRHSDHRDHMRKQARLDVERWGWDAATRQLECFYHAVLAREQELPVEITERAASGASHDDICGALDISRKTLRRIIVRSRGAVGATES
jgi:glycosyltransferase involved in cell wall biosynthesis